MTHTAATQAHPLRVLIVDDEPLARKRIQDLLVDVADLSIVGQVDNGTAAIEAIREAKPHIVFLDIQMSGADGVQVMHEVGPGAMPITVLVTAHDEFALQAFDLGAADYLLKPFSDERFEEAFRRARERVVLDDLGTLRDQLERVRESTARAVHDAAHGPLKRVAVQSRGRMRVIPVAEIDYIIASGVYAELHVGGDRHLVRTSLNTLESQLDPDEFARIHRAVIVRLDQVELLLREGGGNCRVQLRTGDKLPVGRSRREELETRLGRI
ncbi:MAG: LytTR family DNA-binding domain-containing protein [Gemmatimonadota bacterium]